MVKKVLINSASLMNDKVVVKIESGGIDVSKLFLMYRNSPLWKLWPIDENKYMEILFGTNDTNSKTIVFSCKENNEILGVISFKYKESSNEKAVIVFEQVLDVYQKNGIGSELLDRVKQQAKELGIKSIELGGGIGSYFWPGVPNNLDCEEFFKKQGFDIKDGPVDMCQNITDWDINPNIFKKIENQGINIRFTKQSDVDNVLQFESDNFLNWVDSYYKRLVLRKQYEKVFLAEKDGKIVGVSELWEDDCNWNLLFDGRTGGVGALGISEENRGKGIGLAMESWSNNILKAHGVKYAWIGWTYAVGFYEKLGFKVWRSFYKGKYYC